MNRLPIAHAVRLAQLASVLVASAAPLAAQAVRPVPRAPQLLAVTPVVAAPTPVTPQPQAVTVDEFVQFAISRNPRLVRATFAAEAARGRSVQAGLYPNPVLAVTGDELGDRQGPKGIWTAPQLTQEIVTGRKLSLSQTVAAKEADQATLNILTERYALVGAVRSQFYEVIALRRRAEILAEVVKLAEQAVAQSQTLFNAKLVPRLDVVQLEAELERFRADAEGVERELPAAYRRLAAIAGDNRLPVLALAGTLDAPLPEYDLERTRETVIACHPEVRAAQVGIERAKFGLRRAQAEPIPNVTVSTGYVRQNQNRSNDWMVGVSVPVPLWNRNQGNVRAAQAEVGSAVQEVGRVENDLADRVATAFRPYSAARKRAERYRSSLLPRAEETYTLALQAFKGGQFEYLRVLQAQRAVAEARLEYNRTLGEAWKAAAELSGLLLEEVWPPQTGKK